MSLNSFQTQSTLKVNDQSFQIFKIPNLEKQGFKTKRLPYALQILLENLLRREDGQVVNKEDIEAILNWDPKAAPSKEISFNPARVILQDFTGVPAVVDLAAMRDAMQKMGGDPTRINPLQPVELVIDHSVQVDAFGTHLALEYNAKKEFERNQERYTFLRWGQNALKNFKAVPPDTGIVHQVNLEYLARVVMEGQDGDVAYFDTLVGTDSHTTMINGLGVLGWGVGGIEAEAAMLGQPVTMLIPQVVGFELTGQLKEGVTATDLVLTVVQMLRKKGVVGKLVEFYGSGLSNLSLSDRATIANMAPEYGATSGLFPIDDITLDYLRFSGRSDEQVALVEAYLKEQDLFGCESKERVYSDTLNLDISQVEPSLAGPKRPQDRILLKDMSSQFKKDLPNILKSNESADTQVAVNSEGQSFDLKNGSVVIAAITSCTNTSNPSVMLAAGLVAKKAAEKGLQTKPWVKTSLAPGSLVVTDYLQEAGLLTHLEQLRFHVVGYGCTTCIGNSGPLAPEISQAINKNGLVATSVLSGNRNFEGRISPDIRANYLASPPLVVMYALAGRVDIDFEKEAIAEAKDGPVYFKDLWPSQTEVNEALQTLHSDMYKKRYENVYEGSKEWQSLQVPKGATYAWDNNSTYVQHPPYFEGMTSEVPGVSEIQSARILALFGDSVTTDHISPAGSIKADSPAGKYLQEHGVKPQDFNSYGSRRGNHEVMMRGTFANIRIRNQMIPGVEGGFTVHVPSGEQMSIYDAAMKYKESGTPLVVLAGKEYGTGSSRDWAAKGPYLQGVKAVIAQSFERIHRSNLVGMGILPLEFKPGESATSLELTGQETLDIQGLTAGVASQFKASKELTVKATKDDGAEITFQAIVRLDTPQEVEYFENGGILQYVLRQLVKTN